MSKNFCWNIRGLGNPQAKRILRDHLCDKDIDLVGVQETKLEVYPNRFFQNLSVRINTWLFKPSVGSSGGILLGVNDDKYQVLNHWIKDFSISVLLKNRFDSFEDRKSVV